MFVGRLLSIDDTTGSIQLEKEAINFLQDLSDPIVVVSLHGSKQTGKSSLLQDLLEAFDQEVSEENQLLDPSFAPRSSENADSVWLYVKKTNYSHARFIAFLDKRGFSENSEATEAFIYFLLSCISSIVIHNVMGGGLSEETIQPFTFLANQYNCSNEKNACVPTVFPHSPTLLWLLRDVTTTQFKEMLAIKNLSAQDAEQNYLTHGYRTLCSSTSEQISTFCMLWSKLFPHQMCLPIAPKPYNTNFSSYPKQIDKINKFLLETKRNKYPKDIELNGPFLVSVLGSMLTHCDSQSNRSTRYLFQFFDEDKKVWKNTIHHCCLNIVKDGIKTYKFQMSQQFKLSASILDTSDLDLSRKSLVNLILKEELTTNHNVTIESIALPCEMSILEKIHTKTKRIAKKKLQQMPAQRNQLFKNVFHDCVTSLYTKIKEENQRLANEWNQNLLHNLFTEKINIPTQEYIKQLKKRQEELSQQGFLISQAQELKRFFYCYKKNLQEMICDYMDQAKPPTKSSSLAFFLQNTLRLEMFEFHFVSLQKICQQEIQAIQNTIETNHKLLQESQHDQQKYQKDTIAAQSKFNALLTDHATIQLTRKQMLLSAIANIDTTYEIAKKQQFLLEEKALISIQKPYEKVIQEVKEQQKNQVLEGYLIKQGNGSTTFNPLGRKNWKERYFILIGNTLFYAKTKDEYERGHIIKELCLKGCTIETSKDTEKGIEIIPSVSNKEPHIFERQSGFFDKKSKKMSTQADFGRIFHLRAPNKETRNKWITKLRQSTHPIDQTV